MADLRNNSLTAPASGGQDALVNVPFSQPCRTLYVGGTGDVVVTMFDGTPLTFVGVPDGFLLPVRATSIITGTTATNIVALF